MPRRSVGRPPAGDPRIHERLLAWGAASAGADRVGDWPSATLLARVIEFGPIGSSGSSGGPRGEHSDPELVETDRAVAALPPRYRRLVVAFYAGRNRGNSSVVARQVGCSVRQLQDNLRHARAFVAHALGIVG